MDQSFLKLCSHFELSNRCATTTTAFLSMFFSSICAVQCLANTLSTLTQLIKFWEGCDSNPGPLGVKRKKLQSMLCAPPSPSCLWLKWTKLAKKCYCCGCYCCCCYCCFCFTCERFCDLLQNKVEVNRCLRNFEFGCKRFIGSGKNGCFCVEPKTTSFA